MGITSGRSTSYVCPLVTMAAEPLLRTFFSQSVRLPYGRAIKKLLSCWAAMTGVWYVRPDRRPTWRTTDVLDPSLPADLSASGRMARVNKRKAFWIEPFMPPRSQRPGPGGRAQGPLAARTSCPGRAVAGPAGSVTSTIGHLLPPGLYLATSAGWSFPIRRLALWPAVTVPRLGRQPRPRAGNTGTRAPGSG